MNLSDWFGLLVAGGLDSLVHWGLSFLIAAGLTVVFGMLGFLNVAHAAFYMLGGYLAFAIVQATGDFWLALIVAPPLTALVGLVLERGLMARLHGADHTRQLLLTTGLAYVMVESIMMLWGSSAHIVAPPASLSGYLSFDGITLPVYQLFIVVLAVAVIGGLGGLLLGTRFGAVVRAAATHPEMVEALGFRLARVHALVFIVGIGLAALAGVVMAPMIGVYPSMADDALVAAFIVVVAGGLGSLRGAFWVSALLGLLQGYGSLFASDYAMFFPFIVLGGILLIRPLGLYGAGAAT